MEVHKLEKFMYSKKTKKINITVNPYFLDDQSEPEDQHFVWAYQVTIDNQSNKKVQLKNRYWKIIDSNGSEQEVRGEGVVGEQPILNPGEKFEYTSGTPLSTPSGFMGGYYEMETNEGKKFDVIIPQFSLDSPFIKNNLN
ncbi:Co2+/Mg2+ efflux protein ApaG [Pelagibacteraceae bacterium]|nr:Co2+/Mg2+ efflux protein ApaG [Pelagibacteraceae bacterium]